MRGPEAFQNFYTKLKGVQEYHRKFPGTQIVQVRPVLGWGGRRGGGASRRALQDEPGGETEVPAFSGEEFYGKYLDLAEFHNRYLNLAGVKRVDYAEYTQLFQRFDHVPVGAKQSLAYSEYVDDLLEYLVSFFKRTQPLVVRGEGRDDGGRARPPSSSLRRRRRAQDIEEDLNEAEQEFERLWEKFEVPGWSRRHVDAARRGLAEVPEVDTTQQDAEEGEVGGVDLAKHDSVESLQALGMEALKAALSARGLKCGCVTQHTQVPSTPVAPCAFADPVSTPPPPLPAAQRLPGGARLSSVASQGAGTVGVP